MNYQNALLKIKKLENFGVKPGLERIKKLLDIMGNPQDSLEFIHVAGTNGKGSVCFMLESILRNAGYNTGLFISPSIEDFRERIQVSGKMISEKDVCKIMSKIEVYLKDPYFSLNPITEFELTTAMAFEYFKTQNCDIVVLETGMGGKLDATNVIKNTLCSVITTISLDHTQFLGSSIDMIAKEKFGIIKKNSIAVIGANQSSEIYKMFKQVCLKKKTKCEISSLCKLKDFKTIETAKSTFQYNGTKMEIPLLGIHQKHNVEIVLTVLNLLKSKFDVSDFDIQSGLKKVKVPCRIEVINHKPLIISDASHNTESVWALKNFIDQNLKGKKPIAIFCMFKDKDVPAVCKIMGSSFSKIIIVKSESPRSTDPNDIKKILSSYNSNTIITQLYSLEMKEQLLALSEKDIVIVFGTFSIMKDIKKIVKLYFGS